MNLDDKLRLLAGKPIFVNGFGNIEPLKLSRIVEIGYEQYNKYIGFLLNDLKQLEIYEDMDRELREGLNFLDLCFILFENEPQLLQQFVESIRFITNREDIQLDFQNRILIVEDGYLGDNLIELQKVIRMQNFLPDPKDEPKEQYNPINNKARELIEKMKKNRKRLEEAKSAQGNANGIDIYDIISAVTAKSNNLNKLDVWNLTIYQLYDEFNRLKLIDDYHLNIKSLLAGAKDIKLKHWSTKL